MYSITSILCGIIFCRVIYQDLKMVAVLGSPVDLSPLNKANPYMHHNFHTLCDYFFILGWIIFSLGKGKQCINKP